MGVSSISGCNLVSEVVRTAGRVRLRVSGTSMVPAMRPGDLITVERAGTAEIAPGEIVVFARSGRLVVHRVTGITAVPGFAKSGNEGERLLQTRGDCARWNDPIVRGSELLGRVTQIERGSRRMRPRTTLGTAQQVISRLLRISDRAARFYARVSPL
jgi:signal peptidase I